MIINEKRCRWCRRLPPEVNGQEANAFVAVLISRTSSINWHNNILHGLVTATPSTVIRSIRNIMKLHTETSRLQRGSAVSYELWLNIPTTPSYQHDASVRSTLPLWLPGKKSSCSVVALLKKISDFAIACNLEYLLHFSTFFSLVPNIVTLCSE